jgi:site-specific DNA recombinase
LVWQDRCEVLTHPESLTHALEQARGGQWLPQQVQAHRVQLQHVQAGLTTPVERLTAAYLNQVIALDE